MLERFLDSSTLSPHGICLLWEPGLIWLHVISDALIAAAYFSIPVALAIFVSKRRDVAFGWVFWAFALFILFCGFTHVLSIVTLWVPIYGIEGIVKLMTAVASIVTAAMLWPLLPKLLALPSPSQLREAEDLLRQSQQVTGGVAHDFNNLLTVISGNLEIAARSVQSDGGVKRDRLARVIGNASSSAQRAALLTQQLLTHARGEPPDLKPAYQAPPATAVSVKEGSAPVAASAGSETILVVEDEDSVRSYLMETLQELNYKVHEAANGAVALALFKTGRFHVDLLLTDIIMPGLNGRELADELHRLQPDLKVLFMTGYAGNVVGDQDRPDEDVSLLQKPLTQTVLAARIREMLDKP
ncbi:response regulator [Bradyrhizobium sp. BRP22]|uniref:response regulator n=1 Tax=Bradyrhizobium sp. BRP22 TaxID=2793821 RepID=UPI001CD383C1|nr:response regulator [Bradyrhizobium sp. BRP22]MCA1455758.1 response regulator [Bradyrhizobium sp. BRP22]